MLKIVNLIIKNFKSNLFFVNDTRDIDTVGVLQKIKINTQFSFSYTILLASATVVCTLGLLLNSSPVVIGGMLISPLMWPLMKISVGVSFERKSFIIQALHLLIFSILISFISSIFITSLSPLKTVTNEILSRTTPTFLDIFVAVAAGGIAAFSIIQKKISDSLAGVAIATSLMPPLCVSGIGLSLGDTAVAYGGFLLFFTNVISIIFVSVFIFTFVGIKRNSAQPFRKEGVFYIIGVLILTSLPLAYALQTHTFKIMAYEESRKIIKEELLKVSPELIVENVNVVSDPSSKNTMLVDADIISPESINLDYTQKSRIVERLAEQLNKSIDLNLRIQKTISLKSEEDITNGNAKNKISQFIVSETKKYNGSLKIGTIESNLVDGKWNIVIVLRADPNTVFKESQRQYIQNELNKILNQPVALTLNIVPLLSLTDEGDELIDKIKKTSENYITENFKNIEVRSVSVIENSPEEGVSAVDYTIKVSANILTNFRNKDLLSLKTYLVDEFSSNFTIELTTTLVNKLSI